MKKFISQQPDLAFDDVLINPERSSIKSRFDNNECYPYVNHGAGYFLPIVSSPMDSIPSESFISAAYNRLSTIFTCRFLPFEKQLDQIAMAPGRVGGVIGVNTTSEEIRAICEAGAKDILLDVANGGNENIVKILSHSDIQSLREKNFNIKIWAGNVANADAYTMLSEYCDFIRVGIGSGSACTTRINTGCGRGLVTSLIECREAYEKLKQYNPNRKFAKIVADGGIRHNGDFGKAFVAGAHFIMIGKIFAQTYESAARFYQLDGNKSYILPENFDISTCSDFDKKNIFKAYRGMASRIVNEESGRDKKRTSVEGESGLLSATGYFNDILNDIENNLRSTMSYVGASNIKELYEKGRFSIVSPSVILENKAHGFIK